MAFSAALDGLPLGRWQYFPTVGSTNDVVATWAADGAPDLSLAVADEQIAGRGRSGRTWFTPPGSALAFSLLLRPEGLPQADPARVAGLGALAVAEALEALYGLQPEIKWPNDVLLNGRKVCGVLAEAEWLGGELAWIVLGIGINLTSGAVPPLDLLALPATCVASEARQPAPAPHTLRAILERILYWKSQLNQPEFIAAWEARLAYRGQTVRVASGLEELHGTLAGLAEDGRLRLVGPTGEQRLAAAGEIRLRPEVDSRAK